MAEPTPSRGPEDLPIDEATELHTNTDFETWAKEMQQPLEGEVDLDKLKEASLSEQEHMISTALAGIEDATTSLSPEDELGIEHKEFYNEAVGNAHLDPLLHSIQRAELTRQIESENPTDVFAAHADMVLKRVVKEGDRGSMYRLDNIDQQTSSELISKGITTFFENHGQPDPLPTVDQPVLSRFRKRDTHQRTEVVANIIVDDAPATISVRRTWDSGLGMYLYSLTGGPSLAGATIDKPVRH